MERQMKNLLFRFVKDESGVTAIEYGLIAALVSVAILAILTQLGGSLVQIFTTIANALATAAGGG
jgi:pilus assembly protein Flp/PilA